MRMLVVTALLVLATALPVRAASVTRLVIPKTLMTASQVEALPSLFQPREKPKLLMPESSWTLAVQTDHLPFFMEHDQFETKTGPQSSTFVGTFADFLSAHDIDLRHSTVVIGHSLGGGVYLYAGHAPGSKDPSGTVSNERYGGGNHGTSGIGISWQWKF